MKQRTRIGRLFAGMAAVMLVASACTGGGTTPTVAPSTAGASTAPTTAASSGGSTGPSAAAKMYKIGYSNGGGVGNGFREEQVCTAKAQAKASGQVSELVVKHRNTDAAGQAADIRDLVAAGVDAIVFNPNDPAALNPALQEAKAAGIKTVSVDAFVTDPDTYNLYNNQVKYAEIGARWLFQQLNGTGTVWYTRGLAGHPADSDRDIGFKNALKDFPNIKVVPNSDGVFTGWDPAKATQLAQEFISSGQYDKINGIWASGMGKQIVDAIKAGNKKFVPIADADVGGFVTQLLDPTGFPDLKGAAVTNTAAVGGAGITLALKLLNGDTVQTSSGAPQANTVLLDPVLVDNLTPDGQAKLKAWQSVPGMDPLWPLSLSIDGWTTYDPKTVPSSCKGA
ncbi:MAG TPA: substrate-binding domain-containing protein [Candidatus Limnocylindrales bacterium]|jgi:ribose transport system substrate-binding protein|nr:substrate-binding domain-containing protein [Candidatus Limnocylindrales bacterium]